MFHPPNVAHRENENHLFEAVYGCLGWIQMRSKCILRIMTALGLGRKSPGFHLFETTLAFLCITHSNCIYYLRLNLAQISPQLRLPVALLLFLKHVEIPTQTCFNRIAIPYSHIPF